MLGKCRVFEISYNGNNILLVLHSLIDGFLTIGQFEYVSLTLDRLQETVEVLKNSFFPHENVCKMVGLADCPEAIAAYEESVIDIARNGVSVIAVDQITDKVVGVSLNVIQVHNNFDLHRIRVVYRSISEQGYLVQRTIG